MALLVGARAAVVQPLSGDLSTRVVAGPAAGAQVSLILWGWALARYPYLVPPTPTITDAAAPVATLTLVLRAWAGGAVVLFPSLVYLVQIFKRQPDDGSSPHSSRTDEPRRPA
jgi:cytochrome d ubiquinol oxidase subunit II